MNKIIQLKYDSSPRKTELEISSSKVIGAMEDEFYGRNTDKLTVSDIQFIIDCYRYLENDKNCYELEVLDYFKTVLLNKHYAECYLIERKLGMDNFDDFVTEIQSDEPFQEEYEQWSAEIEEELMREESMSMEEI